MTAEAQPGSGFSRAGLWIGLAAVALCVIVVGIIAAQRPKEQSLAAASNKAQVDLGQLTYQQNCMSCHGTKLKGKANWELAPGEKPGIPLNADGITWHLSDTHLFQAIKDGVRVRGAESKRIHDDKVGAVLTDKQVWALIAYFKTTWTARQVESQKETSLRERPAGGK